MNKIKQTLRDSKGARWGVLALVAFTMLTGYFFTDVLSPLKPLLEKNLAWDSDSYGKFTGAYSFFNVFFLMLIFGGVILDKKGIRFTGSFFVSLMIAGGFLNYYALTDHFINGGFGYDFMNSFLTNYTPSLKMAFIGYALFGVGVEIAGITVSKIIVKWFKGKELALAMGLEMAVARFGMLGAFWLAPVLVGEQEIVTRPVALGIVLLAAGLITFLIHCMMDSKLDKEIKQVETEPEEPFRFADLTKIFTNPGFILIALLCVLFYSAVFPFMKYAADLMVNKYGMTLQNAGFVAGLLPFGTMALTPIFGTIYDHKGKGATIMIIGAVLLIIVHGIYAFLPPTPFFAYAAILLLGIGFSLVPSAMWPSVPKIVDESRLGSAYALIFWIQNWGLMGVPMLIGTVLDKTNPGIAAAKAAGENVVYDYSVPMYIFVAFGVAALILGLGLKVIDKKKGYGLEMPNIQK